MTILCCCCQGLPAQAFGTRTVKGGPAGLLRAMDTDWLLASLDLLNLHNACPTMFSIGGKKLP